MSTQNKNIFFAHDFFASLRYNGESVFKMREDYKN